MSKKFNAKGSTSVKSSWDNNHLVIDHNDDFLYDIYFKNKGQKEDSNA